MQNSNYLQLLRTDLSDYSEVDDVGSAAKTLACETQWK